jgi:hypothetical protein
MAKFNINVPLIGKDGNAFAILGLVVIALSEAGVAEDVIDQYTAEAMSGDYNNLLRVTAQWVNVT